MKEIRRKINLPSLCPGRKTSRRSHENVLECLYRRSGKNEAMEAWPTSPVLSEEKNTKAKKKAHKYYERQLKACSWYSKVPRPSWIEIAQPFDNSYDTCPQCCYEEPCGCVIVSYQPDGGSSPRGSQRRPTVVSVGSSHGDTQRVESRTSTEDETSFYDNLCDFCKVTSLERRTKKYSEWTGGWDAEVVVEERAGPTAMCTCAMDHLSFIEWKQLYEQHELVTFSKVDHDHERAELFSSTSDYGTQKSKADSESTINALRESPAICLTVKTPSLGYNSSCSIPNTEQELGSDLQPASYPSMVVSDSEGSNDEEDVRGICVSTTSSPQRPARTPHAFHGFRGNYGSPSDDDDLFGDKLNWIHPKDTALKNSKHKPKSAKNKTSNSEGKKTRSRPRPRPIHERWLDTIDTLELDTAVSDPELITLFSEGEAAGSDDKTACLEDGSRVPSICVPAQTGSDDIPSKIATENDETLPADFLSEFLLIAKNIDEFYESIYAKKFLENRVDSTTKCDSVGDTIGKTPVTFSQELQKSIRSLEKVCCFVDQSDGEDASVRGVSPNDGKRLSSIDCNEPVWRLSQQSLDLMHARRSRSTSSGSSSNRSRCSTNGSRSTNSRCSNSPQKVDYAKFSETPTLDVRSPDSGFSEKASLFPGSDSPDACRLGTKWAGSMQWDYTDWYFFGYDCNGGDKVAEVKEQNLTTIHETTIHDQAPQAVPQDPLDWDW